MILMSETKSVLDIQGVSCLLGVHVRRAHIHIVRQVNWKQSIKIKYLNDNSIVQEPLHQQGNIIFLFHQDVGPSSKRLDSAICITELFKPMGKPAPDFEWP